MNRPLALLSSIAFVSLASACLAAVSGKEVGFTLTPDRNSAKVHATFRDDTRGDNEGNWSTGFKPSELIGLEVSSFRGAGSRPIRFALVREAGRLDCAGTGGGGNARGTCRFTADENFARLLASRGIGRPDSDEAFSLMAVNAHRELIDAAAAAQYPTPSIHDVIAMSALNVDGRYIASMVRIGYRPESIHSLIEFKALGITPEWIGGFARVGYEGLRGDGLVQMRALDITPEFISGYQRIGYRNLPVNRLVELKALNITPEFVRSVVRTGEPLPEVKELVQMKIFGRGR